TMEVPSRFAGRIGELRAEPGQQIKVGQVVLTYETDKETGRREDKERGRQGDKETGRQADKEAEGNGRAQRKEEAKSVVTTPVRGSTLDAIKAAPSVRQVARKLGIDLGGVRGSGPAGRILIGDLTSLVQRSASTRPQAR